jgi:hypothetical protein
MMKPGSRFNSLESGIGRREAAKYALTLTMRETMYCYVVYINGAKVVHVGDGGYHLADDGPPHMFTFKELMTFFEMYGETFALDNDKIEILTVR